VRLTYLSEPTNLQNFFVRGYAKKAIRLKDPKTLFGFRVMMMMWIAGKITGHLMERNPVLLNHFSDY
jgi:hypothetical protein